MTTERTVKLLVEVELVPDLGDIAPADSLARAFAAQLTSAPYVLTEGERWEIASVEAEAVDDNNA